MAAEPQNRYKAINYAQYWYGTSVSNLIKQIWA